MHGSEEVKQVDSFKYLGVTLDTHLDFKKHVSKICAKVTQRTGLLWRIQGCIGLNLAKDLYTSLIDPHFQYCSFIYDSCQLLQKRQLQISQNKALRAVMKVGNRYSPTNLHNESGINWLGTSRAKSTCIEVYKVLNGNCSANMSKALSIATPVRTLRSNTKVKVFRGQVHSKFGEGDFCYRGPILGSPRW